MQRIIRYWESMQSIIRYRESMQWMIKYRERKPPKVKLIGKWVYIPETIDFTQISVQKINSVNLLLPCPLKQWHWAVGRTSNIGKILGVHRDSATFTMVWNIHLLTKDQNRIAFGALINQIPILWLLSLLFSLINIFIHVKNTSSL